MKKPESEILNRIISIIEDRRDMELAIKELKERANSLVDEISAENYKFEIAAYLYWLFPEIRSKELSQATLGEINIQKFLNSIHSVTASIDCERCGNLIEIKSRTQLSEVTKTSKSNIVQYSEGYKVLCESCRIEVMDERRDKWKENQRIKTERQEILKTMPYRDYLQTPEWKERRQKHLLSADYRCQICNSVKQPLNVHHRTYERRGNEYYTDLIVLCRDCHVTFHENGKLAKH